MHSNHKRNLFHNVLFLQRAHILIQLMVYNVPKYLKHKVPLYT